MHARARLLGRGRVRALPERLGPPAARRACSSRPTPSSRRSGRRVRSRSSSSTCSFCRAPVRAAGARPRAARRGARARLGAGALRSTATCSRASICGSTPAALLLPDIVDLDRKLEFQERTLPALRAALADGASRNARRAARLAARRGRGDDARQRRAARAEGADRLPVRGLGRALPAAPLRDALAAGRARERALPPSRRRRSRDAHRHGDRRRHRLLPRADGAARARRTSRCARSSR